MTTMVDGTALGGPPGHPVLPPAYRPGELVGVGGSASVYRATDRRTGDTVAVKVLHSTADPATAARFAAEVRMLRELRHPGLAQIVDAGVDSHHPYLVTRFVEGRTLQVALHDGEMGVDTAVGLGARLASTLAHVHARGIVHRDVKPANILLDEAGLPFLTDFGVSRIVAATQMTETGVVVGTPAYMAPEQVRGVRVGPAADVYALGLVLLEMLTGLREYPGGLVESAVARLHRRPRVPTSLPAPLRDLLTAMTEDEPERRPTAAEVATRLVADDAPAHALPLRRAVAVLAMAVAIAVVALGVFRLPGEPVDATAGAPPVPTEPAEVGAAVADPVPAGVGVRDRAVGPVADLARTVRAEPAPAVTTAPATGADRGGRDTDRSGGREGRESTTSATGTAARSADREDARTGRSDNGGGNGGQGNGRGVGNGRGIGNGNGGDQDEQ
ncbi:serine/threonine-protein kinase [Pseudonocardia sp.]|jgi:hypothetical protein|uniref:serine/threonine-protein kinase n=1 Tax=Pseudonocardia sp. TaxID=60912 RepID=UPI003D147AAE